MVASYRVKMSITMQVDRFGRHFDGPQRLRVSARPFVVTRYFLELPTPARPDNHVAAQKLCATGPSPSSPPPCAKVTDVSRMLPRTTTQKAAPRTVLSIDHKMPHRLAQWATYFCFSQARTTSWRCATRFTENRKDTSKRTLCSRGCPWSGRNVYSGVAGSRAAS